MTQDDPWLTDAEQHTWRQWMALNAELLGALQRDMQEESGLSNPDYQVLVVLSEAAEGRLRVTELAQALQWDRSRLSHHVARMERRDLVDRKGCADDGRGAFVRITSTGRDAVERAAPGHARAVRALVFDALSGDEVARLGEIFGRLRAGLDSRRAVGGT